MNMIDDDKYQCPAQTSVVSVRQSPDFAVTGQWEVQTETREGQKKTHIFDAVMVCTGHFTQPHLPLRDFPGICIIPPPGVTLSVLFNWGSTMAMCKITLFSYSI